MRISGCRRRGTIFLEDLAIGAREEFEMLGLGFVENA
jgi:hypothetical protein